MVNLYWLDQIHVDQLAAVGWKALHLSHLMRTGCPVLPGFVMSSHVLQTLLEEMQWTLPLFADFPESSLRLNVDNAQQLQTIAQQLRQAIATVDLSHKLLQELQDAISALQASSLILRPSLMVESPDLPTSSQLTSQSAFMFLFSTSGLNPDRACWATVNSLNQELKRVWGDLFGAKSLFYWQQLNIPLHRVKLAVLVQPLPASIASGTFQVEKNYLKLNVTAGLGLAIVQGEVIPDTYEIQPKTNIILSKKLGQKSIAYRVPDASLANTPQSVTEDSQPLQLDLLNDQERVSFTLSDAQVQQLVQRLQDMAVRLEPSVNLEWTLVSDQPNAMHPYITQVEWQSLPQLWQPRRTAVSQVRKGVELFPDATLIATGLAASSGHAIARASILDPTAPSPENIPPYTILVTRSFPLDWLPLLKQAAGLISEQGSLTSHSAIVAREFGIPAVLGVKDATQQIQSGELVWVDGDRGRVYQVGHLAKPSDFPVASDPITPPPKILPVAHSSIGTRLWLNINQLEQLPQLANLAVDGVGLVRAELLALAALEHQSPMLWLQQNREQDLVERMTAAIAKVADTFQPRPVLYRSFDLRPHEFSYLEEKERGNTDHSVLGIRGTFSYQVDATLFNLELTTLARVRNMGYANVHLMLPFVRTVEEFQFCRQLALQAGLLHHANFQLWIMAEVPSVLLLLPDYVQAGVQGISIGTNDLTQLMLGVDRDDAQLATQFEQRHPAVKRAIAHLIREAQTLGIPCSICGEAPVQYPELIADLVQWGIHSISVAPEAFEATYWEILRAEQQLLLSRLRSE